MKASCADSGIPGFAPWLTGFFCCLWKTKTQSISFICYTPFFVFWLRLVTLSSASYLSQLKNIKVHSKRFIEIKFHSFWVSFKGRKKFLIFLVAVGDGSCAYNKSLARNYIWLLTVCKSNFTVYNFASVYFWYNTIRKNLP